MNIPSNWIDPSVKITEQIEYVHGQQDPHQRLIALIKEQIRQLAELNKECINDITRNTLQIQDREKLLNYLSSVSLNRASAKQSK